MSSGDVAAYGQRRLVLQSNHISTIENLEKIGKDIPKMKNGQKYAVGQKAEPVLQITDWDIVKIDVMYKALKAKFTQHTDLQTILLATGNAWLVEHTKNDTQWADGDDGRGTNYLGKLLIILRESLTSGKEQNISRDFLQAPMTTFLKYEK